VSACPADGPSIPARNSNRHFFRFRRLALTCNLESRTHRRQSLFALHVICDTILADMVKRKAKKPAQRKAAERKSTRRKLAALPKEAVTLLVQLRAKRGQHLMLQSELRALIQPTRKEEGCLQYDLHRALDDPNLFLLHEVWASREHHQAHRQTPHFLRWDARKDSLLASRDSSLWRYIDN
jgi:quinol monooxygenase YgiN